jgi:hypothetical protein
MVPLTSTARRVGTHDDAGDCPELGVRTCLRTGHVRASRRVMRTIMAMRTIASWWSGLVS